jgi:hypothetical protein
MEVSVVPGCGLRSRVRGFESCRRLGPALLWTPGVIFDGTELHVIEPESATCPARAAGRLVPYVTDPRACGPAPVPVVLLSCVSSQPALVEKLD